MVVSRRLYPLGVSVGIGASAGHSQLGPCFELEEQNDERNENARIYCHRRAKQQRAFAVGWRTVFGWLSMVRLVYLLLPVLVRQLFLVVLGTVATAHGILNL